MVQSGQWVLGIEGDDHLAGVQEFAAGSNLQKIARAIWARTDSARAWHHPPYSSTKMFSHRYKNFLEGDQTNKELPCSERGRPLEIRWGGFPPIVRGVRGKGAGGSGGKWGGNPERGGDGERANQPPLPLR